jgi:hypothetical protein
MEKSSRHSEITGDFAEALVLYWLSKSGYECACVDHTGIDLIACKKDGSQRLGISVQGRSRHAGTEKKHVNLHPFENAREACRSFGCDPFSAIVVDGANVIRCFLLPLDHLEQIATGKKGTTRYWLMSEEFLEKRRTDPKVRWFELQLNGTARYEQRVGRTTPMWAPVYTIRGRLLVAGWQYQPDADQCGLDP